MNHPRSKLAPLLLVAGMFAVPCLRAQAETTVDLSLVLIIDEIGYLPMNREQANLFFQVVADRHS
jgi:hypothetical protein